MSVNTWKHFFLTIQTFFGEIRKILLEFSQNTRTDVFEKYSFLRPHNRSRYKASKSKFVFIYFHLKFLSLISLANTWWIRREFTLGFWYNLALFEYICGDKSQFTLNHQSQANTACENWVPLGQRKLAWRPSISQ